MQGKAIIEYLKTQEDYAITEEPDSYKISWRGDIPTTITKVEMETMDLPNVIKRAHQGRNVEHITRVTGYFSKVSGWNAGKRAELLQRVRTSID